MRAAVTWSLVYGVVERSIVVIELERAEELAATWRAICSASTWGELRGQLPAARWEALVKTLEENGDDIPSNDSAFNPYDIPGLADGDYPEWPAQEMVEWMPREILDQPFSKVELSVQNGEFLTLDPAREVDIVAALRAAGFQCEKNQLLVDAASGVL